MRIRFAVIGVVVMSIAACVAHSREETQKLNNVKAIDPIQEPDDNWRSRAKDSSTATLEEQKASSGRDNSAKPFKQGNYMTLTPTAKINALGNPIYELRLYADGQLYRTYPTVSGRSNTQDKDRNLGGTEAPLPDGIYLVASAVVPGTAEEVGNNFLPIEPLFLTGRSDLGIHYDPSFEQYNGEDGTSGCIGLTNELDLDRVLNYVGTHRPEYLEVKIQ